MRTGLDFERLVKGLRNYAEKTSRYMSPVEEGTLIGYSSEADFGVEEGLEMLDFCREESGEAGLFLHISQHWLEVRRDYPSRLLAFLTLLPFLTDHTPSLTKIKAANQLISQLSHRVRADYTRLKRDNERLQIQFLQFRIRLERLDVVERARELRNYEAVIFLILPTLFRLHLFLTESFAQFKATKKEWRRFGNESRKCLLHLVPLPHLWTPLYHILSNGILAYISTFFILILLF